MTAFFASHSKLFDQLAINALLALSLSVCLQAGQLALAQAAFMGIAAYIGAILGVSAGLSLLPCMLIGTLGSTLAAMLLALPVRNLRGVFLAIATIGFGEIVRIMANNLPLTGGGEGLSQIPPDANTFAIYAALIVVSVALFFLSKTKFALAVALTREDETAARGVGVDVAGVRFWTLALGGAIAGVAGVLYAHSNFFITPGDFGFGRMEQILVACVIGGSTSAIGAAIGSIVLTLLPETIRFLADYREVTNGAILLAVVLFAPRGIAGLWQRGK